MKTDCNDFQLKLKNLKFRVCLAPGNTDYIASVEMTVPWSHATLHLFYASVQSSTFSRENQLGFPVLDTSLIEHIQFCYYMKKSGPTAFD